MIRYLIPLLLVSVLTSSVGLMVMRQLDVTQLPRRLIAEQSITPAGDRPCSLVWLNDASGIFHHPLSRYYGHTKRGRYLCEEIAIAAGNRAALNEP